MLPNEPINADCAESIKVRLRDLDDLLFQKATNPEAKKRFQESITRYLRKGATVYVCDLDPLNDEKYKLVLRNDKLKIVLSRKSA